MVSHTNRDHGWPDVGNGDAPCCMGAAVYGPGRCTCWVPVYDQEQQQPKPGPMVPRTKCCHDCAFRMGSPERRDDPKTARDLDDVVGGRSTFACHVGMRRAVAYVHPSGARVDAGPGDYRPLVVDGVAFRADGSPASACAGQRAMRAREVARG